MLDDLGIEDAFELTGLYEGVALTDKSVSDMVQMPDAVWLFRRPILDEWAARGDVALDALVRHVLVHEIAHHFGMTRRRDRRDRRLAALTLRSATRTCCCTQACKQERNQMRAESKACAACTRAISAKLPFHAAPPVAVEGRAGHIAVALLPPGRRLSARKSGGRRRAN